MADLEIVTNRIDKLGDLIKKPRPAKQKELDQAELDLLQRIATALEKGQGASVLGLKDEEEKSPAEKEEEEERMPGKKKERIDD